MKLKDAVPVGLNLISGEGNLQTHFIKWRFCGSIRRQKEEVFDIDIVAIEKHDYSIGEPTLDDNIKKLDPRGFEESKKLGKSGVQRFSLGESIKRFRYKDIIIDIYLADEKTYETLILIRTGSKEHNIRLTTLARGKGLKLFAGGQGLCKIHMEKNKEVIDKIVDNTEDGILLQLLGKIPKPEERD